ncbi:MAG: DnaJ sub C member 1 [Icmadophila ericetorum]|nr:DnaJ sub C member 1 [Icmadophila ericetorum]
MKSALFMCLFFGGLMVLVAGWDKEDHEIFRLRDEIERYEGLDVTFYDFMGVKPGASQDDINKAYRKKGKLMHPDKVKQNFIAAKSTEKSKSKSKKPGVHVSKGPSDKEVKKAIKEATERFARLGLINQILKGPGRARYDHFLENGFPKWRGTGYYYARFRPGLGSVLIGLFIFGGGLLHYGALMMSWKRQRTFVERYISQARKAAWGDAGIKGIPDANTLGTGTAIPSVAVDGQEDSGMVLNRRERRLQERESKKGKDKDQKGPRGAKRSGTSTPLNTEVPEAPQGQKKRVEAENGKMLLVDSVGNVFLEEENEDGKKEEFLLDPNEIVKPTFRQTVLFRLPVWAYQTLKQRLTGKMDEEDAELEEVDSASEESEEATPALKSRSNGGNLRKTKQNGRTRRQVKE